jgi:hypothetical protein
VFEPRRSDHAPSARSWRPPPFCHPRPPHRVHPPPRTTIKGARRAADFPFPPPPSFAPPSLYSTLCRCLDSLMSTTAQLPSSSVEPPRRTSPNLLRVATTCSPSHRSATPPGKCFPLPLASSTISPSTAVVRAPQSCRHLKEHRMTS